MKTFISNNVQSLFALIGWIVFSFYGAAGAEAATVSIDLENLGKIGEVAVPIGAELEVIWPDAPKNTALTISVRDEEGFLVAERTILVGEDPWTEPQLLWSMTGVWGCDELAALEEANYRFIDFDAAFNALIGRLFNVNVEGYTGSRRIRFVEPLEPIYYFSDVYGCPRGDFAYTEEMYLSGWTVGANYLPTELLLFLGNPGIESLSDVRREPQAIFVPPYSQKFTERVGSHCEIRCGDLIGIVRPSHEVSCESAPWDSEDITCEPLAVDLSVFVANPEFKRMHIKGNGSPSGGMDDGRCDNCAPNQQDEEG